MATSRKVPARRTAVAIAAIALVVAAVLVVIVAALRLLVGGIGRQGLAPLVPPDHCVAVTDNYRGSLMPEQAVNAAIIVGESIRRQLPARAATIALVTALQESGLLNLDYGDRDSLGLFQQRPSQGWGTPEQIMDPWYSAGKFYAALVKVKNWQTRDIGEVAQAVQRSAYPNAYQQYENSGRAWASTLTGQSPAGVGCINNNSTGGGGDDLVAFLNKVWGNQVVADQNGKTINVTAQTSTTAWAVAQLSMALLAVNGLVSVQVGNQFWQPDQGALTWRVLDQTGASGQAPVSDKQVVLTLL